MVIALYEKETLEEKFTKRHELARFIVEYLYDKTKTDKTVLDANKEEVMVEFSVLELKNAFLDRLTLFDTKISTDDVEDALFYLSRIDALKIEDGFMVVYNAMAIQRLEEDIKKRYKAQDYEKLNKFYDNKVQQIHIVGEYARKMINNYKDVLQFVDDYFQLNYDSFLNKYFKGSRKNEIRRNITPDKFRQLFGELPLNQLKIISDKAKHIVVAAGPGSGKTRVLVHKLASLLLIEDVKHEQLLMVTFSRAAATEFKKRLMRLIGNAANYIEIKTFHAYCFDLLGRVGTLEKSDEIIKETISRIKKGEVEASRITKTVLVIDEAQDMDADEYELVSCLMEQNKDMRLDYFQCCQDLISKLRSGDELLVDGDGCRDLMDRAILKFSKQFKSQVESLRQKNYLPKTAKIKFIVYWRKEDTEYDIRILLPEIYFEQNQQRIQQTL